MDLNTLNEMQRLAVCQTEGPVLVLAGAGSGKTRVLTMRTAYLIKEKGVSPYSILAITFTNKAAQEMKERIETLIGVKKGMWISTFHATCVRILRSDIDKIGYEKSFSIYDESDSTSLLKDILHKLNIDKEYISPKAAKWAISKAKNMDITPERYEFEFPANNARDLASVYTEYEKQLKKNNALDFDDLLQKTLLLFRNNKEVLSYYGNQFKYILVDEYQDTNLVQYEIVRKIAKFHGNIFVVGDDDQAIYGWRGADIRNILEFEKDFPGAKTIRLERNYRSHQKILDVANSVIENNSTRKGKKLWTECREGDTPLLYTAQTEYREAEFIAFEVARLKREGLSSFDDIAIMYRTNSQSRVLEEELKKLSIPYRVYGGTGFYERKEIKDIAAYLNLIVNTRADISLDRIINEPKRGIGNTTLEKIKTYAALQGLSEYEACREAEKFLDSRAASSVMKFVLIMEELIQEKEKRGVSAFVDYVLDRSGMMKVLHDEDTPEARARIDNLQEFLNNTAQYENQAEEPTLEGFLERNSLIADIDTIGEEEETVSLITLHSAKGLEFDTVFMAGMQEGLLPHSMAEKENGVEEERRLCYVGMTRAKKRLYLTWAKTRLVYSKRPAEGGLPYEIMQCECSRFVDEVPITMLENKEEKKEKAFTDNFTKKREERKSKPMSFAAFERNLAVPSQKANVQPERFAPGKKVWHDKFGDGMITKVNGEGTEKIAVVNFKDHGEKKMFVAFAPLTIVE